MSAEPLQDDQYEFPGDIEGYSSPEECRWLYDCATRIRRNGIIVELGSYKGRSAVAFAQAHRRVYCIDLFEPEPPKFFTGGYPDHHAGNFSAEDVRKAAALYGVLDWVSVIKGSTVHIAHDFRELAEQRAWRIDLLFIDACHQYDCVRADFTTWEPFMAQDGTVIFDDVSWPGVMRFLNELRGWAPVEGPQVGNMIAFQRIGVTRDD